MGLKEFYYSLEEKYYAFLDKLDRFVPVNGLVDKVDRVVPTFPLFVLLLAIMLGLLVFVFSGGLKLGPEFATLKVYVEGSDGHALENASISAAGKDIQKDVKTNGKGEFVFEKIPFNSTVNIIVDKLNYKRETASVVVDEEEKFQRIVLALNITPPPLHTIEFRSPDGAKLSGVEISVHFECTNTDAVLSQKDFTVTAGEIEIKPPIGCGFLVANATTQGLAELSNQIIDLPGKTLTFAGLPVPLGTARVIVKDAETKSALENIKVTLFDETDAPVGTAEYTDNGEAVFSVAPGSYEALAEDSAGNFGSDRAVLSVSRNQTTTTQLELTRRLAATLKIRVVDKDNQGTVTGAKVVLKKNGKVFGEKTTSEAEPQAVFALKEKGVYSFVASHADYLSPQGETIEDLSSAPSESIVDRDFVLEKCKPEICGALKVRVVDEKNDAVENAKVFLFNSDSNTIALEFGQKTTDSNGYTTTYLNLGGGKKIYAQAQKYPSSGNSRTVTIDPLVVNEAEVRLSIGEGEINVEAFDELNAPVPFALVEVYTANSALVGTFPLNEEGKGTLKTKADKEVFVVVKKDRYLPFVSTSRQVVKNDKISIRAELSRGNLSTTVKSFFKGFFDEKGSLVSQTIEAGKNYTARFNLFVPDGKSYSQAGLHVRTGKNTRVEDDKIFIRKINAPKASVSGSATYNPPSSTAIDTQNMSSENVKWANIVLPNPSPGTYSFEVELRVRPETVQGTELLAFYRSFGITGSIVERDPIDPVLGNALETGSRHALYAEAYKQVFFEGAEKICDESFCYSQSVLDVREGLRLNEPFKLRVFDNYKFSFSITNNSGTLHDSANLRMKNTQDGFAATNLLSIENYSVTNADLQKFESTTPLFETESPIPLGYFSPFKSIEGEMTLQPKDLGQSNIQLVVVSGVPQGLEVFNKQVAFEALELEKAKITVAPEKLVAFKPITLEVTTEFGTGAKEGKPIENARIVVTKTSPDGFETKIEAFTDQLGKAAIEVCTGTGCSPGTKIIVEAQKQGIKSEKIELEITDAVVEFDPKQLEFNLNISNVKSEFKELEIKNLIPETVKISRILLRGSFDGILDIEKMNAFLQQYPQATTIGFEESTKIRVLAELNDNARLLEEVLQTKGSILFDIQDLNETTTWPMKEVPLNINVDLAQPPKEPNCLIVSPPLWEDSVLETASTKGFSVVNNCVTENGEPMELKNLQATIEWSSDEVGQVVVSIQNPSTGEASTQVLQGGIATMLLERVPARAEFIGLLSFVPKPSKIGEQASFKIKFNAELLTASGKSLVEPNKEIDAQLLIINLSGCIKTNPQFEQVLNLKGDDTGTFSISTEECGEIPIDIRFCHNDSGCSGGAGEGSIGVSPTSFSDMRAEARDVTVSRETIAGIYGVKIEARPRGGGWREVGEVLALFEPKEGTAFKLSKYDFIVIGHGAKDTATLTNSLLSEEVQVDASDCDWGTAEKEDKSLLNMAGAGVGAAAGALLGAGPAINAAQQASQAASAARIGTAIPSTENLTNATTQIGDVGTNVTDNIHDKLLKKNIEEVQDLELKADKCEESINALKEAAGGSLENSLNMALDSGIQKMKDGVNTAFDNVSENMDQIDAATSSIETAGNSTKGARENFEAGKTFGGNAKGNNMGAGAALEKFNMASVGIQRSLDYVSSTIQSLGDGIKTASKNIDNFKDFIKDSESLTKTLKKINDNVKQALNMTNPDQALIDAVKKAAQEAIKNCILVPIAGDMAKTSTDNLKTGLEQGKNLAEKAKDIVNKSIESLDKTISETEKLQKEWEKPEATQNQQTPDGKPLDTFNEGRFIMIEGLYAGLGALAGGLLPGLLGGDDDPCDERTQFNVVDWVINLKNDAKGIGLDREGVGAEWNTREAFTFGEFESQEVGVVFTNNGANDPRPVYGVAEFSAVRHFHANPTIIPLGTEGFGPFNVPDQSTEEYVQKFHLRFKTAETEDPIQDLGEGAQSCVSGVNLGQTGPQAIPKVRFDWNWKNFSMDSCDVKNPNAIYCDATQFNFEIGYRLDALKEFLDKNREKLTCPQNPADDLAARLVEGIPEQIYSGELPSSALDGKVSLVTYTFTPTKDSLTVTVVVGNSSGENQSATARVELTAPSGIVLNQGFCDIQFSNIEPGKTKTNNCTFSDLQESGEDYSAKVRLVNASTEIEEKELQFNAVIRSGIDCWMPASTELYDGRPAIDYYVEKAGPAITWTSRIPDRQSLTDMLVFDAYLIRDGYSDDFLNDFEQYSNKVIFFDTPSFFNKIGTKPGGQQYGFDEYYKSKRIGFRKKYVDSPAELSRGGVYRVELKIDFGGTWQFFDQQGNAFSNIDARMQLVNEPQDNHVFYQFPIDGAVGLQGTTTLDRKGYGIGFVNENPDRLVTITPQGEIKTFENSSTSNALVKTDAKFVESFFELNSNPVTRGSLLLIENTATSSSLRFAPSLATPVILKMTSDVREDSFGAYYSLLENESKANVGSVLNYWSGMGQCLDFSGEHVKEAFDEKPDRLAAQEDRFVNWENTYTLQWADAVKKGDVYLEAVFYSSPLNTTELRAEGPLEGLKFLTPDQGPANVVGLQGINLMPFNSPSSKIESIEQVFELVSQGVLCQTSTGNRVSYWWNPKNIIEYEGNAPCLNCEGKRSALKEEQALQAGSTCIGAN